MSLYYLVYGRDDGGLDVVIPAPDVPKERVIERSIPSGKTYVETTRLPSSRRWRNAWRLSGSDVVVDLDVAKKIRAKELAWQGKLTGMNDMLITIAASLDDLDAVGKD